MYHIYTYSNYYDKMQHFKKDDMNIDFGIVYDGASDKCLMINVIKENTKYIGFFKNKQFDT